MKKTIEALWTGKLPIPTLSGEDDRIFNEKSKKMRDIYAHLEADLTPDGKRLLAEYSNLQSDLHSIENKSSFVHGFSFGIKLITEGLE